MTRIPVEARQSREQAVSDVALLERVAAGDIPALWELSARHSLSLRALAFGILRDPVAAEQVVQATFREVRYEAARFDPAHFPVFGWLAELTRVGALQRSQVRAGLPSSVS
jgi:DNA-directed RNA polymerase specialized sigma24 family protein